MQNYFKQSLGSKVTLNQFVPFVVNRMSQSPRDGRDDGCH